MKSAGLQAAPRQATLTGTPSKIMLIGEPAAAGWLVHTVKVNEHKDT